MTRKFTALAGLGLVMGGVLLSPSLVAAQGGFSRSQQNRVDPNAKRVMITVFKSSGNNNGDKSLGVQAADAMRSRMDAEFSYKQVYVLPKTEINSYLEASGFTTTDALAPHDAKALASLVRADEYLTGTVNESEAGYKMEANLVLSRDNSLVQPLGTYEGKKMSDVANLVSKELKEARKQLEFEQKCFYSAREGKYDEAIAFAKEGVAQYPAATLARICQVKAMELAKSPNDQILALSREIVKLDPRSRPGLSSLADAFRNADMQDSAVVALTRLLATDPGNPNLTKIVVEALADIKDPKFARPVIDEAVQLNPGDPELLKLRWLILLATRDYKEAFKQGDELARLDTAFADTTYFVRTAAAHQADSQYQKAAETAARGLQKFPGHADLTSVQIAALTQAGQNQQALEALTTAMNAKIPVENGGFLRLTLLKGLGRVDEMLPAARELINAGDTTTTVRQMILFVGDSARKQAQATESLETFEKAVSALMYADSVSKGETKVQAQFLLGATYVTFGQQKLNTANANKDCTMAKQAKDLLVEAQIMLPRGGSYAPDVMRQLMGAVMQLDPYADQIIKSICK